MPTSASPIAVVLGVSPGNSPSSEESDIDPTKPYKPPTFGEPHRGLSYQDGSGYWTKVRALLTMLARRLDDELTETQALALSGHFNLGLELNGKATPDALDRDITTWVSRTLVRVRPRTIVGLGLVGLLVNPKRNWRPAIDEIRAAWKRGGLDLTWEERGWVKECASVNGSPYTFRLQDALIADERTTVVLWPNHPSHPPFTGPNGPTRWGESVEAARIVLRRGHEWKDPA